MPSASAAFVNVKHPAVWVQHFTVSGGDAELRVLKKGLADMLITDILDPLKTACNGVVVEREHFDQILAEILLSQSPLADPSTRMTTARIIQHNRVVTGGLTVAGGMMTLTVNITNVATGAVRTVSRSTTPDRFFELEQSVVQEVVRLICGDEPPAAYTGQASGSTSGESGSSRQTISWSGNVRLRFNGDVIGAVGNDPPGEYAYYEPESGGIHMIVDGAEGECTYHGEATPRSCQVSAREAASSRASMSRPTPGGPRSRSARPCGSRPSVPSTAAAATWSTSRWRDGSSSTRS